MEVDYLRVAYELSILSFYIGVLIYALPIPWPPLKRWAPRLMIDGFFTAALAALFYGLLSTSDYVARVLGGSWELFQGWLSTAISTLISLKGFVFVITMITSQFPFASAIGSALRPVDRVADIGFITIAWISALMIIVSNFGKALAAIGIALSAVPFRISRSAGAWLLSFVLVFNAGLQVLPSFLATLAEQPGRPDPSELEANGLAIAKLHVIDYTNRGVGGGILYMYNSAGDEWAKYIVSNGLAWDDDFGSTVPVPSRTEVYLALEIDNVRFNLKPYPLHPSDYQGNGTLWEAVVSNKYLVWVGNYTIIYTTGEPQSFTKGGNHASITVYLNSGEYIAFRTPSECSVSVNHSNGLESTSSTWEWMGMTGTLVKYTAKQPGEYTLSLTIDACNRVSPDFGDTENYLERVGKLGTYMDIDFISSILLYYTTIPLLYTFVLFTITTGLARILGGRERLFIKV